MLIFYISVVWHGISMLWSVISVLCFKKRYVILSYGMILCNAKRFEERVPIIFRRGLMFPRKPYSSPIY